MDATILFGPILTPYSLHSPRVLWEFGGGIHLSVAEAQLACYFSVAGIRIQLAEELVLACVCRRIIVRQSLEAWQQEEGMVAGGGKVRDLNH